MTTPNMNLTLPTVSVTPGPTWASEVNSDFSLIDAHDHTTGKGLKITTAALNIDATLSLNAHSMSNVGVVGFLNQKVPGPASVRSLYALAGDLWFNDQSGNQVQITSNGTVNVGGTGNIGGITGSAAVNYLPGSSAYEFIDAVGSLAGINAGSLTIGATSIVPSGSLTINLPSSVSTGNAFVVGTVAGSTETLSFVDQAGYITRSMQAAVGQQIQSSATTLSATSSTPTDISGSITITTTGRPVFIGIDGTNTGACFKLRALTTSAGKIGANLYFQITASGGSPNTAGYQTIAIYSDAIVTAGGYAEIEVPLSSMSVLLPLGANTYTIKLQADIISASGYNTATLTAQLAKIYAYEL